MKKISIIYGSSTDNTKEAAQKIAERLNQFAPELKDVAKCDVDDFTAADCLILGTSTWGVGELQDDWYSALTKLKPVDLSGKTVALFGLGDLMGYSDTFVNGMGELYEFFAKKGCKIVGFVDTDKYSFEYSSAVVNGEFVGLPIDANNESHLTDERITAWLQNIKEFLI